MLLLSHFEMLLLPLVLAAAAKPGSNLIRLISIWGLVLELALLSLIMFTVAAKVEADDFSFKRGSFDDLSESSDSLLLLLLLLSDLLPFTLFIVAVSLTWSKNSIFF